jgi:phage repressor protein C with HTH and peptisase S24 domain
MLTHAQIWMAIDRLAARSKLSASGLAKRAGLDPTTFNKSKRITPDGRARWPSTESIAKSLAATGATLDQFVALIMDDARPGGDAVPLISFVEAGVNGRFDDNGFPSGGEGWDAIPFPAVEDTHAYAIEITGDALDPAYRDGTHIIVSPAAPIRRGDRVIVKIRSGGVLVKELKRKTARTLELKSLIPSGADHMLASDDVLWVARVIWASQ